MSSYVSHYADGAAIDEALDKAINSVTLGETSSTAYRGDHGKTAYDHSQAAGNPHNTNLAQAGGSNENLLHNWDHQKPVNQRIATSYTITTTPIYVIDRWLAGINSTFTINAGNVTSVISATYGGGIWQRIEYPSRLSGKTVTVSFKGTAVHNIIIGMSYMRSGTRYVVSEEVKAMNGIITKTITLPTLYDTDELSVYCTNSGVSASNTLVFYSSKIEIGSVSTLANDAPADYGAQLAICQRYYLRLKAWQVLGIGRVDSNGVISVQIPTPAQMRINPTVTNAPVSILYLSDSAQDTTASAASAQLAGAGVQFELSTAYPAYANKLCTLVPTVDTGLSADL